MLNLTFDDLFGSHGIIPLSAYTGLGDAVCPYCQKMIRHINFPPPGVIIIHSCPSCSELVIPFTKQLVAVRKDKLEDDKAARTHITECLYNTITPVLLMFASRFMSGQKDPDLKAFLDNCWNIVYDLVGDKEDSETFLDKIKKKAIDNTEFAKEYEAYFDKMSQIFEKVVSSKPRKQGYKRPHGKWTPVEVTEFNKTLAEVGNVDDFLKMFNDSIK